MSTMTMTRERDLLGELEPVVEDLLRKHEKRAKPWYPHTYVPYSMGRDFDDKDPWTPDQPRLTGVAQTSFLVNLLTEDNLPSYHREIHRMFGAGQKSDSPWIEWIHRWTAEEGRHAIVLRDYLVVTRNIDPVLLEDERMEHMQRGYQTEDKPALHGMAYVSFQELATRVSHRNTGRYSDDPVADRIMARISADENLHMVFYRDSLGAAMHVDPDAAVRAIADEVIGFEMPGANMQGFQRRAFDIAMAGIYDLKVHHDEVVWPLLRHWGIFEMEGLSEEGERARDELATFLDGLEDQANTFVARRERKQARDAARRG